MKKLLERTLDEDWRKNVATGLLGASLLNPSAAVAAPSHHHHRLHQHGLSHHSYSEQDIINTIVGEAANQGYQGMLGIASAIRNRYNNPYYKNNILHGAYGLNAKHTSQESPEIFAEAKKAWEDSKSGGNVGRAYLWGTSGDIAKWQAQPWFHNVRPVATIGAHTFFEDAR